MPRRKEDEKFAPLGEKNCWHLYGLQTLTPNQFAKVVGQILGGRFSLVNPGLKSKPSVKGF
ncbi:MAG: hypothetical protein V3T31_01495 [candidate division Zixibacteria bacterium]